MASSKVANQLMLEPLYPEGGKVEALAVELVRVTASLASGLHPVTAAGGGEFLRLAEAWYANFSEGLACPPSAIETALKTGVAQEPGPAAGAAHLLALAESAPDVEGRAPAGSPARLHMEFMSRVGKFRTNPGAPGELRKGEDGPVAAASLPDLLARFAAGYGQESHPLRRVMGLASSHHRLLHLRPFPDGNGRVALLFTSASTARAGVHGSGLWSTSRAIARGGEAYRRLMEGADALRWGDLDGRGRLSLGALNDLCCWMLGAFAEEAAFMAALFEREKMLARLEGYAARREAIGELERGSFLLLREAFLRGTFPRGDAPRITGRPERTARRAVKALTDDGLLVSASEKTPLRLTFPVKTAPWLFPGLFPEAVEALV